MLDTMLTVFVRLLHPYFVFLFKTPIWEITFFTPYTKYNVTSKRQRLLDVALSTEVEYRATAGYGPLYPILLELVLLNYSPLS